MTEADKKSTQPRESTRRAWRLARKELREILRDRRTVITLILMPLLVYPLLGSVMSKGILSSLSSGQKIRILVVVETEAEGRLLASQLLRGEYLLQATAEPSESPKITLPRDASTVEFESEPGLQFALFALPTDGKASMEQFVADGDADLGIRIREREPRLMTEGPRSEPFRNWTLLQRRNSALSKRAVDAVIRRLEANNRHYADQLVKFEVIPPIRIAEVTVRELSTESEPTSPLVTFIPLVLVLMTMTGAVYPAIDLTAGERERGTMEILVAAPVPRMTLLAGKFVAVLVVALLTASMNLLSMFVTLFALGLHETMLGGVNATMIFQIIVLMVVFAAFFSSVLLSITSVARSFKEAQAYLIPLMLVSLTPGIFALMPDVEINGLMAVTPLINTVLMGRDLLAGDVNVLMFAIVLISTALYGVLALSLAARVFGSDAVLYGSAGTWSDLFRRPKETTPVASVAVSTSCLAVLFSMFITLGSLPARLDISLSQQLIFNTVVLVLLFVAIPLLFAAAARVKVQTGFSVHASPLRFWIVALLLGVSLWPFLYELQIFSLSEERIEFLKGLMEQLDVNLTSVPLWLKLTALAIAPAVCEEFFFRGFLQNSIRQRSSAALAILASAILFGLFHVIVKDALLLERLLPSTLMGIALGILMERSGSVLPGMLLHVLHNGLLITVSHFEEQLTAYGVGMSEQQHLPIRWIAAAAVPALAAFAVLILSRRNNEMPDSV